jgi:hypothetical protein
MKVHIFLETDQTTNGRIAAVFTDRVKAEARFYLHVAELALDTLHDNDYEQSCTFGDELWSCMPDDTEEHSNISVSLFFDVEVV